MRRYLDNLTRTLPGRERVGVRVPRALRPRSARATFEPVSDPVLLRGFSAGR